MIYVTIGADELWTEGIWEEGLLQQWQTLLASDWESVKDPSGKAFVLIEGFNITHTIESPSSAYFKVLDINAEWDWKKGDQVTIELENESEEAVIFAGFVDSVRRRLLKGMVIHEVTCTDYHYVTNKRLIGAGFVDKRPDEIVTTILEDYLEDEDITLGEISTSDVTIDNFLLDYVTISEALDRLAEYAGFTWYISELKELYFVDKLTYASGWDLYEYQGEVAYVIEGSFSITSSAPEYRNKQIIKGGNQTTSTQTETFIGDGTQKTFVVAYPVAEEPTVTVDSVAQDIGIRGVETGYDFYWSKDTTEINQDLGAEAIAEGAEIEIQYKGLYPVISITMDMDAIDEREETEGGTGISEAIEERPELASTDEAKARGNALLENYAQVGYQIEYESAHTLVIAAGAMQSIYIPALNIDTNECLITSNEIYFSGPVMKQRISGVIGPVVDYWTKLFVKLSAAARTKSANSLASENAVTVTEAPFHRDWLVTDSPNPWISKTIADSLTPSSTYIPCFDFASNAFTHVVLYRDVGGTDTEFYRQAITTRTSGTEGGKDLETVIGRIASANGNSYPIVAVALWGGDSCTSSAGTGIMVDKWDYEHEKTVAEILQLTFEEHSWE